jgi:hypothetical protein
MPPPDLAEPILDALRDSPRRAVVLSDAAWLVWPVEEESWRDESWASAAMSSAQFVHFNAPVLAVQRNRRMEYFDGDLRRRWSSNLPWPRANLEMARLPGRANFSGENASAESSPEKDSLEKDSPEEGSPEEGS